ncbi:hypothetical protein ONS95_009054 [Cadophora gregata]|uniref:uncharacterized protein n=1 Tax=Cadophora gregata TaxID=51156 RepID=UPI0026DB0ACF|nr:uncharacterized protein ONS95_009054 [Cadophora gregata]KAK0124068.1 hypothetical protein ONS95_009054 [Cadophora gregata]
MGTTGYDKQFLNRFRFWDQYNKPLPHPPRMTKAAIKASYNATFMHPPGLPAPPTIPVPHPVATPPVRPRANPKPPAFPRRDRKKYQNRSLFKGPKYQPHGAPQGGHLNWLPVKYLGQGGGGAVVLWEYNGPLAAPLIRKIAVKNKVTPDGNWLLEEGQMMSQLMASNSEHIVRLLVQPRQLTAANRALEGGSRPLPKAWEGVVRRLIMEYCSQGSLGRLLAERRRRNLPFEELTLWRIFECIVDGLSVLEFGDELIPDQHSLGRFIPKATFNPALDLVVHFDLKPDNIFGVDNRTGCTHPHTQTWKIGDFGLAQEFDRNGFNQPAGTGWQGPESGTYVANDIHLRHIGTEGFFCPEQFSPRWNYADYRASSLCAKYGRKTNVWGVGQIMYELACFDQGLPEAYYPFNPSGLTAPHTPFSIGNTAAKGILYGTHLRATPYSNRLKDTIHQCLYEEPHHLLDLMKLKTKIKIGIAMCSVLGAQPEGWHTLDSPEPRTAAMAKVVPPPSKRCTRTVKASPGSTRCSNWVTVDPENMRPRCGMHYNLIKFPWQ